MFTSIDPATGAELATYEEHDRPEMERRVTRSHEAWQDWARTSMEERTTVAAHVAELLERDREEHAALMTQEMGKPIRQARAEADKCAWLARHFAEAGPDYLAPEPVETEAAYSAVRYDPLGPILAIMPWNFPYWQVLRFGIPAIVAGNTVLLKHAENVMGTAVRIEELFTEAGLPDGVFQTLMIDRELVPEVLADDRVRAVTLTGSVGAGQSVAQAAGRHGKKSVLELGGSDPFIVLEDADVERAAEVGVQARLLNSGQSCIAAKRFLVVDAVADAFIEAMRARMDGATVGDPTDEATDVGPIARSDLREQLDDQVQRTIAGGGRAVLGGHVVDGPGFFYAPTLLIDVEPGQAAADEETFGPAAAVLRLPDEDAAIARANASVYGLGASVWTADLDRAHRIVPQLEAGAVSVNDLVKSDPRLPFGGVKMSGYGRELGAAGAREFTNIKSVWMQP